jgi:hypothetical protein
VGTGQQEDRLGQRRAAVDANFGILGVLEYLFLLSMQGL